MKSQTRCQKHRLPDRISDKCEPTNYRRILLQKPSSCVIARSVSDEPVPLGAISILDHPVKSQRDPADRMMTVGSDEIAPIGTGAPSLLDGSQ
jgi:hypothetical protein